MILGAKQSTIKKLMLMGGVVGGKPVEESVTGNPARFFTDLAKPLRSMIIPFYPVQSGTGDPSPDNIRPISGWSGLTAWRTGINLFDKSTPIQYAQYYNGVISTFKNRIMTDFIPIVEGETYTFSVPSDNEADLRFINYALCDKDKNWLGGRTENGESSGFSGQASHTFTVNIHGSKYVRLILRDKINPDTLIDDRTLQNADVQLEVGNTATPYAPYTGASYPVTFPDGQIIYGGTIDAVNRVLTVDKQIYNLSDISWINDTNRPGMFYGSITGRKPSSGVIACSTYLVTNTSISTSKDKYISGYYSYGGQYVFLRDTDFAEMTATEMKEAVTGQLVYELATPIEIPLDPITVQTLIGDNTIWTDTNGENAITFLKKG